MIQVNFFLELFSCDWFLVNEGFNSLSFSKNEQEVIINIDCLADNFEVLSKGLRDLFLSFNDNFIFNLDVPEMHFVTSGDSVLWSWEVATLLHDLVNDLFKLLLNRLDRGVENDSWPTVFVVVVIFLDVELK